MLFLKVSVVLEVSRIDFRTDGADPAVRIVEETCDESRLQDLVIVESYFAQLVDLRVVDVARMRCDEPRIFAEGIVNAGKFILARTEVSGQFIDEGCVLPHAAEVVSVGLQAVGAAVVGGYDDADHLLLCIRQIAAVVVQGALEIQEADIFLGVERENFEQIVDESPVLHHEFHILIKDCILFISHIFPDGLLQTR